jgi:hypothetical protein
MPLKLKRLNQFEGTMVQTTQFAVRMCLLGGHVDTTLDFGVKLLETPIFWNWNYIFSANQYPRITFER